MVIYSVKDSNILNDGLIIRSLTKNISLYPIVGKAYYYKNNKSYEIMSKYIQSETSTNLVNSITYNDEFIFDSTSTRIRLLDDTILYFSFKLQFPTIISSNSWFTYASLDTSIYNFYSSMSQVVIYSNSLNDTSSYLLRETLFTNGDFRIFLNTNDGGYKTIIDGIIISK